MGRKCFSPEESFGLPKRKSLLILAGSNLFFPSKGGKKRSSQEDLRNFLWKLSLRETINIQNYFIILVILPADPRRKLKSSITLANFFCFLSTSAELGREQPARQSWRTSREETKSCRIDRQGMFTAIES